MEETRAHVTLAVTVRRRSAPGAPPAFGAHRHELVATLLLALHSGHPVAALASQLCADVATAAAHDVAPGPALTAKYSAWQQQRVLGWVNAVRTALQATAVRPSPSLSFRASASCFSPFAFHSLKERSPFA